MTETQSPQCTVIVPVYEQWHLVPRLLEKLREQTLAQQAFEVLLVDNGSSEFTPPQDLPTNTRVLRCFTPGSYAARNHAAEQARGQWLVFTDADCLPAADWLEHLMNHAAKDSQANTLLAGGVRMIPSSTQPTAYEMYDLVKGIPQARYVSQGYAATANLALPAALFRALGGFDAQRYSGGDADFCRRAVSQGAELRYVPEVVVDHPARTQWRQLATKARRVKGGQLTAGSARQRLVWLLRTFTPPLRAFWQFLRARHVPVRYRVTAVAVQMRIWGVEILEVFRLVFAFTPERR
ncbi:MAG: glycosyltransferase [Ectothiorhodospiraceae bacterium]|nr:glycosyltransferase [Ectothiorhodospiraceae bacterium]